MLNNFLRDGGQPFELYWIFCGGLILAIAVLSLLISYAMQARRVESEDSVRRILEATSPDWFQFKHKTATAYGPRIEIVKKPEDGDAVLDLAREFKAQGWERIHKVMDRPLPGLRSPEVKL